MTFEEFIDTIHGQNNDLEDVQALAKECFGPANGGVIHTEYISLTPELAKKWIGYRHLSQRGVAPGRVQSFARDLAAGKWSVIHQGFCFDKDGNMTDGQHRAEAVARADVTVPLVQVTWNSLSTMEDPVDRGRPRSFNQITHMSTSMCAALAMLCRMESGNPASNRPSTVAEIQETAEHHKVALEIIEHSGIADNHGMLAGLRAASVWTLPIDEKKTLEFLGLVQSGEMLRRGDPAFAFRKWREHYRGKRTEDTTFAALACLRHHIQGKQIMTVHPRPSAYRASCSKRRALNVPNTPSPLLVTSVSWNIFVDDDE